MAGIYTSLLSKTVFTDVLRHQCGHTSHLGRGHGGTGHRTIGVAVTGGVDVTTGCSNLRLQLQTAGNAPTGEFTHGIVIRVIDDVAKTIVYDHCAFIIGIIYKFSAVPQGIGILLGHTDAGSASTVTGKVHDKATADLVIIDDHRSSTGRHSIVGLVRKADLATGADRNCSFDGLTHSSPIGGRAKTIDQHISALAHQGAQRLIVVTRALHVEDRRIPHQEEQAGIAGIIHRRHRKGVGVRTR